MKWQHGTINEKRSDIPTKSFKSLNMKQSQRNQSKAQNSSITMIDCSLSSFLSISLLPLPLSPPSFCVLRYFYLLLLLYSNSLNQKGHILNKKQNDRKDRALGGGRLVFSSNQHTLTNIYKPPSLLTLLKNHMKNYKFFFFFFLN